MPKQITINGTSEVHELKEGFKISSCGVTFEVKRVKQSKVLLVVSSPGNITVDKNGKL